MPTTGEKTKNKPALVVRIGKLKAIVWENDLPDGGKTHNITFRRLYKSSGNDWRTADNVGTHDLLLLAQLATEIHNRLVGVHVDSGKNEETEE